MTSNNLSISTLQELRSPSHPHRVTRINSISFRCILLRHKSNIIKNALKFNVKETKRIVYGWISIEHWNEYYSDIGCLPNRSRRIRQFILWLSYHYLWLSLISVFSLNLLLSQSPSRSPFLIIFFFCSYAYKIGAAA